jgi:hypothetical protein
MSYTMTYRYRGSGVRLPRRRLAIPIFISSALRVHAGRSPMRDALHTGVLHPFSIGGLIANWHQLD